MKITEFKLKPNVEIAGKVERKRTHSSTTRSLRFLHEIPHFLAHAWTNETKALLDDALFERLFFFAYLLEHELFLLMVLVLTARLQVELVYAPIAQVVVKGQHAHVVVRPRCRIRP
jgi:hypothetical protein